MEHKRTAVIVEGEPVGGKGGEAEAVKNFALKVAPHFLFLSFGLTVVCSLGSASASLSMNYILETDCIAATITLELCALTFAPSTPHNGIKEWTHKENGS